MTSSFSGGSLGQNRFQVVRGLYRRVADHVCYPGRIGSVVFRGDTAVRRDDFHPSRVDPQNFGNALDEYRARTLPDFRGSGQDHDRAVEIELQIDSCVGLTGPVHRLRGTGYVVRTPESESLARRQPSLAFSPSGRLLHYIQAFRQSVGIDPKIIGNMSGLGNEIGSPDSKWIQAKALRHLVKRILEGMTDVDGSVAAKGAARRCVGEDPLTVITDILQVVDRKQHGAGIEDSDNSVSRMTTAPLHGSAIDGCDPPV